MENDKWLIRLRLLGYLNIVDRYIMKLVVLGYVYCYMCRIGLYYNEFIFI